MSSDSSRSSRNDRVRWPPACTSLDGRAFGRRERREELQPADVADRVIMSIAHIVCWLMIQAPLTGQDTVLVRQIADQPSMLEQVTSIASAVLTISFLVLTVALTPAAWNFRRSYKRINTLLDRVYGDINPIMRHASSIADDVNYITTAVRVDVQQINQTIALANQRLLEAVRMTEDRIREVNALLIVAQEEAEAMFVSTASTVRGIRAGASVLRDATVAPPVDAADDAETLDDEFDEFDDLQAHEVNDGDDDAPAPGTEPERPRIKRRPRDGGIT